MVCFPNAKINIGLNIINKRTDGFHNIETIFYPIPLFDVLEFTETENNTTNLKTTGNNLNIPDNQNICLKAFELLNKDFNLKPLEIFLHKVIPSGAGLGGGSADAAFFIKFINNHFEIGLNDSQLEQYAAKLGSDCPFFIRNKAVFAYDKGGIFEAIKLDLSNYFIYLVKPDIFISTAQAYANVIPSKPKTSIKHLITSPIENWKDLIINDFESNVFSIFPILKQIKEELYNQGAIYASMSGSGSSIYGIFKNEPDIIENFNLHFNWISKLQ